MKSSFSSFACASILTVFASASVPLVSYANDTSQVAPLNYYSFAVTCIRNDAGLDVGMYYKWGDNGTWTYMVAKTGYQYRFAYTYPEGSTVSPKLFVEYDKSFEPGYQATSYFLVRYASTDLTCDQGKRYYFSNQGWGIEVYSEN